MPWTTGQELQSGKYVIDKVLGQGGFGITYKALQVKLNRSVVIKTPKGDINHNPEYDKYVERFIQEGQILARLSQYPHPHIVGVIDLFQEGDTHCLVMDFVPGENLFDAVKRRGALPETEIVTCIREIGEALSVVHQAGLVHRDAHPGNIMLRNNGRSVLIDFGIAKGIDPKTLSTTNKFAHRAFAPYEQISSGSRNPTVDVYCLAATLYYGVTGQYPTTSLDRKLHDVPLTPPKQIISSISERLNQAILKGMALEAKDRPQTMQAWLAMLDATPPPSVKPVDREEAVRPKIKPNPEAIGVKPATKRSRIIPWGWLVGVFLIYAIIGYLLGLSNAPSWAMAMAVGMAVGMAVAGAVDVVVGIIVGGTAMTIAVFMSVFVAGLTGAMARAGAVGLAGFMAGAETVAEVMAGDELRKSFSKFHTFLILTATSLSGLSLELLGNFLFHRRS